MEEKILNAVKRFSLLSCGESVTVALSGGADSVSLLFALLQLKKSSVFPYRLRILTI